VWKRRQEYSVKDLETTGVKSNEVERVEAPEVVRSEKKGNSTSTRIVFVVIAIALCGAAPYAYQHFVNEEAGKKKGSKDKTVAVTIAKATVQEVPISIKSIGNVLSYSVVNVIPQVGGQLKKVYFTQGQAVKKGDLLFEIDPIQYDAAYKQSLGNVARDKAQVQQAQATLEKDIAMVGQLKATLSRDIASSKYATVELGRYNLLQQEGAVSREQSDQTVTNAATTEATTQGDQKAIENAQATVKGDRAAIETARGTLEADEAAAQNAKIQLSWTQIRSPIDGRTSSLNVYEGNVVTANANAPLVTIDQVQPIYVNFTVPEQYLDEVRKNLQRNTLKVDALIEGRKKNAVNGAVSFLQNTVDTTTGTVLLRAAFANTEAKLYPGQFVDVVVTMPPDGQTVVVPGKALQTTQQGTAVYILKPDNTVTFSPVEVARSFGDLAALSKGVQAGDTVITDGQLQLTPGSHVQVVKDASAGDTGSSVLPGSGSQ
jgi:multidrug efflux system membrane fusion protein